VGKAFDQYGAKAELEKIASRPPKTHVFRVSNFDALDKIRDTLEESIFSIEGRKSLHKKLKIHLRYLFKLQYLMIILRDHSPEFSSRQLFNTNLTL
jgi:hypothetical protein